MTATASSHAAVETEVSRRPATATDEAFLRELFESAHPDLQLVPLPADQLRGLIEMQCRAQRLGYATQWPAATDTIIERDGRPVGRLLVDLGAVTTIVDIAVLPRERNRGVGSAVLSAVLATADENRQAVQLSVSNGNQARRLYERLGFAPVAGNGLDTIMERRAR
jgi:ribosomal protein S18 acetylase RimI-like enzyme